MTPFLDGKPTKRSISHFRKTYAVKTEYIYNGPSSNVPLFLIKRSMTNRNAKLGFLRQESTHTPLLARDFVMSILSGYFYSKREYEMYEASDVQSR
jgi:hypothetical protein